MPEPLGSGLPGADAEATAAADPRLALTASLLRRLLRGLAIAAALYFAVGEPFLFANKRGALAAGMVCVALMLVAPELLRRRGRVRAAAWTTLLTGSVLAAGWVVLSGGVASPGCLLQLVLIQVATLLLGRRGALAVAIPSLAADLACMVAVRLGHVPPVLFPTPTLVAWAAMLAACVFIASPLEYFLARLGGALDDARSELVRRREVEAALRERQAAFRTLFEQSPLAIALTTVEGTYLDVNQNFCTLAGTSRSEVIGKTALDLGHVEAQVYEVLSKALAEYGSIDQYEAILHPADGGPITALVSARIIDLPDRRYVLAMVNSITQRVEAEAALRESEARYRRIVDTTDEGIWTIDEGGVVTFVNRRMAEMLGYGPEEMIGREVFAFLFPEDSPWFEERMAAVRCGESFVCERRYIHRDGNTVATLASIAPSIDDAGRFQGAFAMMIDITAQKRDQAEREELRHRLEQSQKLESIGRLAGGVAHDFNNLLTVINGYSDMLIRDLPEDDPDRPAIEEIRGAGERAAGLTKQLLAFGRRQIRRPRPLDLNAVIRDAAQMLQRLIGEDITLETSLDPALEAVEADPGQVHQVLLNLSINARDAMTDGGALTISTANARFAAGTAPPGCQAGAYVTLTVADTGAGMDEDTMRHLFEPFFTTKPDGFGTGLGLATVYGIVEQSGGSIQVHSETGKGCRFDIHLPCAKGPVEPVTPSALKTPEQRRDLTVLVVEDQDSVRGLASRALRDCGYNVLEAGSGEEAVGLAGAVQDGCQLVVTDVVMPGMSGKAMADELRVRWPDVKVLFMSGYPNEVLLRHGLMNGEIHYLEKPFTPAELAAKVREVMG
jgi:PAS domain S-box-containing protein